METKRRHKYVQDHQCSQCQKWVGRPYELLRDGTYAPDVCPNCGTSWRNIYPRGRRMEFFEIEAVWYKPWTWQRGEWRYV